MTDYSRFEALAREEELAEQREKEQKRNQNREKYFKEQEEKRRKYEQEQEEKRKKAGVEGHGHSHGGGAHGHSHGDTSDMQPLLTAPRRPACGCGYADVEEMKRAAAIAAQEPQLSVAEKNAKKIAAVHATREHGKQLFQEGKYAEAYAVYERGVLICSGIFGVEPQVQEELTQMEVMLDLNMSMCLLKQGDYPAAIDQCRIALQLDPSNVKAYYRMAQASVGMGEYARARTHLAKCTELDRSGACKREIAALVAQIRTKESEEREKVRQFNAQMEAKLAAQRAFAAANAKGQEEAKEPDHSSTTDSHVPPSDAAGPHATPVALTSEPPAPTSSSASDADADANDASTLTDLAAQLREAKLQPTDPKEAAWSMDGAQQQPLTSTMHEQALS